MLLLPLILLQAESPGVTSYREGRYLCYAKKEAIWSSQNLGAEGSGQGTLGTAGWVELHS